MTHNPILGLLFVLAYVQLSGALVAAAGVPATIQNFRGRAGATP